MADNHVQDHQTQNDSSMELVQRFLIGFVLVSAIFIIVTYIISMGLGILVVFSTEEGLQFSLQSNNGLVFLVIWIIFAICFIGAWKFREDTTRQIKAFFTRTTHGNIVKNNLLTMPMITSMLFIVVIIHKCH